MDPRTSFTVNQNSDGNAGTSQQERGFAVWAGATFFTTIQPLTSFETPREQDPHLHWPIGTTIKFNPVTSFEWPSEGEPLDVTDASMGEAPSMLWSRYISLTCMEEYKNKSFEELRLEDYAAKIKSASTLPQQQERPQTTTFGPMPPPISAVSSFAFGTTGFGASTSSGGLVGNTAQTTQTSNGLFGGSTSALGQPRFAGGFGTTSTGLFEQTTNTGDFTATAPAGTTVKFKPVTGMDTTVIGGVNTNICTRHQCVTLMKEYENKSFEELRVEDYAANRKRGTADAFSSGNTPQQTSRLGTTPASSASGDFTAPAPAGTTIKFKPATGSDVTLIRGENTFIDTKHQCITSMKEYENKSFEELRVEDYAANRKGGTADSLDNTPSAASASDSATDEQTNLSCPVCFGSKLGDPGSRFVSTVCGHIFCSSCIEQVMLHGRRCPTCRTVLHAKENRKLYL